MARIFISYRRDDSAGHTGRIGDYLRSHFGQNEIFHDVEYIAPGLDFVQAIEQAVASCDVLLAVIGRHWLTVTDANGQRRLDNPDDYIRLEIVTALQRNIRVIPVLVHDAPMPRADQLPEPLQGLARRNAMELHDTSWSSDMERLISVLDTILAGAASHRSPQPAMARGTTSQRSAVATADPPRAAPRRTSLLIAVPMIVLLALAGGWLVWTRREPSAAAEAAPTAAATQSPAAVPSSAGAQIDLTGTYQLSGVLDNGTEYGGTLKLSKVRDAYVLAWQIPNEYAGIGLQQGTILSVAYGSLEAKCAVISYRVQPDGSLEGRWLTTDPADGGSERGVPSGDVNKATLAGTYSVTGTSMTGATYQGSMTIIPHGSAYDFGWTIGGSTYRGVGIRQGDIVSVAYGTQPCAVSGYQVESDGVLRGQYSGYGSFTIGTEDAVRQ